MPVCDRLTVYSASHTFRIFLSVLIKGWPDFLKYAIHGIAPVLFHPLPITAVPVDV